MRRSLVVILAGLTLAVAGCGGGEPAGDDGADAAGGAAAGDEPAAGEQIELSYALWNPEQAPIMEELAAQFTEMNPNVEVSVQVTPFDQYFTKLQTSISGGAGPDVFWMNAPNLALYASNDTILPLSERVEAADDFDLSMYPDALVELYTREGTLYAIPRDFDTIGLWYNKALFDAAGVEYPDDSWTWDDLRAAAQELTNAEQGVHGITAALTDQQGYYNTIAQAGGFVVSEDGTESGYGEPEAIEGLQFWTDLIEDGSSPTHAQMTDTEPKQLFLSGKSAMFYGGSWQAVSFRDSPIAADVDVAPLPDGVEDTTIIHGLGNAINANTENADAAWEFVKFLSSQQAAEAVAESGIVIPAYEGTEEAWLAAFPDYDLQGAFLDKVEVATPFPVTDNTAEWQALEKQMLPAAWTGERPVDEVAPELAEAMNQVLSEG